MKLIDVKLSLKSLRNVVEYEEALKSALASSASGTYGGMLVDVYVGVVSGSSPEAVKLGYEHVRRKLRGPSSAHVMALFATEDSSDVEESSAAALCASGGPCTLPEGRGRPSNRI